MGCQCQSPQVQGYEPVWFPVFLLEPSIGQLQKRAPPQGWLASYLGLSQHSPGFLRPLSGRCSCVSGPEWGWLCIKALGARVCWSLAGVGWAPPPLVPAGMEDTSTSLLVSGCPSASFKSLKRTLCGAAAPIQPQAPSPPSCQEGMSCFFSHTFSFQDFI